MKNKKFTRESTLAEVLKHPKANEILKEFMVPCVSCPFAKLEMESLKLEEIARMYGIDLEKLLEKLNNE